MSRAATRAIIEQDTLRFLAEFDADAAKAVRGLVPPESLRLIESASALEWIPIAHGAAFIERTFEVLGTQSAMEFISWAVSRHVDRPLLRSTLAATKRVFGLSPAALVRATPVAWAIAYRDFGRIVIREQGSDFTSLTIEDPPTVVVDSESYCTALAATFASFFIICDVRGEVAQSLDPETNNLDYRLEWWPRRPAPGGRAEP